jgi:hypothetical protein
MTSAGRSGATGYNRPSQEFNEGAQALTVPAGMPASASRLAATASRSASMLVIDAASLG